MTIFDIYIGLGVLAVLAEDELVDKAIEIVLELRSFMSTVDDPAVVSRISIGLRTKFKAEVLDDI